MILDFLSGMAKAYHLGTLNSKKDITKKAFFVIFVMLGIAMDLLCAEVGVLGLISTPVGEITFTHVMSMYVIGVEGISIVENAAQCGLRFPKLVKEKLEQLQGESE